MFSYFKASACSCDIPKSIVEFQSAKYVFEGKVISKIYSSDSLTYTVNFKISKHYKNSDNPKSLKFLFQSEGKYTGNFSSCDWSVSKNEKWLIYAYYQKGSLTFRYYCSNSMPFKKNISKKEKIILENANQFEINKYTFTKFFDGNFTKTNPMIDLDSIFKKYGKKKYGKHYNENRVDIVVDIDKNGNLLASNLTSNGHMGIVKNQTIDSIYDLNKPKNIEIRKPKTEFEKDIIKIVKKLKKWKTTYIKGTKIPVRIRLFLQFYKEQNEIKVYY